MRSQSGQVVLILVLVMTVALAIGISVIQRSLSDISTSSRVEQSSRAFSAAEAGIEKALNGDPSGIITGTFDNQATASIQGNTDLLPCIPGVGTCAVGRQLPLEYPPLAKEEVAHVWLSNLNSVTDPPASVYTQPTLEVYWGNSTTDFAALELTMVYYSGGQYQARKWYLDNSAAARSANNFDQISCTGVFTPPLPGYRCKKILGDSSGINNGQLPTGLKLIRARLLYNKTSQPFAVWAVGNCGSACSITPQARILTSTGTSGTTQRKVRLFQILKVVPPYFDYAIFSAGEISK